MDLIYKLYVALFQRAPEKNGVDYWYKDLINNNFNYSLIANEMINAASNYSEYYPQYQNINLNDYNSIKPIIEIVYKTLFNKTYQEDPEGIDYWINDVIQYQNLGKVILNIISVADKIAKKEIKSDENTYNYALAFENKIEVSKYVSEKFKTFNGNFQEFQNFIKNVDYSQQSIKESIKEINNYFPIHLDYNQLSLGAKSLLINKGAKIDKNIITYSFPKTIPQDYKNDSTLTNNWHPLNDEDKKRVYDAFDKLLQFLNVEFQEVDTNGDIRFNKIDIPNTKEAGFTIQTIAGDTLITQGEGSDIFLSNDYSKDINGEDVILHELGHALGLKHPFEGTPVLTTNDNTLYTIMSYTQKETYLPKITIKSQKDIIEYTIIPTPLGRKDYAIYDIEALEYLYGKKSNNLINNKFNESNLFNDYAFKDIFDDGGIDTLNLNDCTYNTSIYLEGGDQLSSIGESLPTAYIKNQISTQLEENNISDEYFDEVYQSILNAINENTQFKDLLYQGIKNLTLPKNEIENVITGNGDDYIKDNKLDNNIYTNDGDDTIIITEGNDFIDGGEGYDILKIYDTTPYQRYLNNDTTYLVFEDNKIISFKNIEDYLIV